jgi:CubicO group peptidase (beta-lactamase class C family)
MRNATGRLLIIAAIFGLASAARADFCDNQSALFLKYIYGPKASQAVGGAVVTFKFGEKPCPFFFGEIEYGSRVQPDANTVFELASVTKVFTTAILGLRWLETKIEPSDPVNKHLPDGYELTTAEQGVTFQQLATFTGGFWWDDPPDFTKGQTFTQEDFVNDVNALDPTDPLPPKGLGFPGPIAGEQYLPTYDHYSNGSTGFLGQILMHMDSKTKYPFDANGFSDWIADNVTGPLNMPNTRVHPGGTLATGYAFCKTCKSGFKKPVDSPFPWVPWGAAGALRSTEEDMLKFLQANICAHHVLDTSADPVCASFPLDVRAALFHAHAENQYNPTGSLNDPTIWVGGCGSQTVQAWAWAILEPPIPNPNNAKPIIYKDGGHPGFSTFIAFSPDKAYGVVILLNTGGIGLINAGLNMIQHTP